MRRVLIFREGTMMGAMIGIAGFGATIRDAMRDLADQFDHYRYQLSENTVIVSGRKDCFS
jgi:hypothetical protein